VVPDVPPVASGLAPGGSVPSPVAGLGSRGGSASPQAGLATALFGRHRIRIAEALRTGVPVTVVLAPRTGPELRVVRLRLVSLRGGHRTRIATVSRRFWSAGTHRVALQSAAGRRKLRVGAYRIEARVDSEAPVMRAITLG
jgi:hypothetical protein